MNGRLTLSVIALDAETITHYGLVIGKADPSQILLTLAQALAVNPQWENIGPATLLVRQGAAPRLAVLGRFDAAVEWRINALGSYLTDMVKRLRFIPYPQVEQACQQLAERLIARFGYEQLRQLRYVAIPRGGFIVLGLLAYHLGLSGDQFVTSSSPSPNAPLVVVDDCALTGARFRRLLAEYEQPALIYATLYSHPHLRQAIETAEARVTCLSAQDLHDHGGEYGHDDYGLWRTQWATWSANTHEFYWVGLVDHICFPWNEPDISIWNPVTEQEEDGWYLLPPDLCLKNQMRTRMPLPIQIQPEGAGWLKPVVTILFGELEDLVVISNQESNQCLCLDGVAAAMWRAILASRHEEEAVQRLVAEYDVAEALLRNDLEQFINHLVDQKILEPSNGAIASHG